MKTKLNQSDLLKIKNQSSVGMPPSNYSIKKTNVYPKSPTSKGTTSQPSLHRMRETARKANRGQ